MGTDKQDDGEETGECGCGAVAEYFGFDPFESEMCRIYWGTPRGCEPGCGCHDGKWMCWECHDQSVLDL